MNDIKYEEIIFNAILEHHKEFPQNSLSKVEESFKHFVDCAVVKLLFREVGIKLID